MIKPKQGYCTECGNTEPIPIIKDKCQYHYWQGKRKRISVKPVLIKPISDSQSKRLSEYRKVRKEYLQQNPICKFPNCNSTDLDLHHGAGRVGSLLTDVRYFVGLCRYHHIWVENNPIEAKILKLSFDRL